MSDRLMNGEKLDRGQSLTSRNGAYTLTLQDDRNLVLYGFDGPAWASNTETDEAPAAEAQEPDVAPAAVPEEPQRSARAGVQRGGRIRHQSPR